MKLAVAGCPRNCSEALVKDVGVVAVGDDRWDVLIGGAAGASVRRGDVLATVDGHDEVVRLSGVFMQYYRENARWLERTYDFVPRVGLDELKAILVDDRDGIVAGLEERMQAAVDAYRDPWQDGREPSGPGQFANNLPLLPLPIVPVRPGTRREPAGVVGGSRPGGERTVRERGRNRVGLLGERRHDHVRDHGTRGRGEPTSCRPGGRAGLSRSATRWWRCSGCGRANCGRSTRSARTRAARWRTGSSTRRR